MIIEYVGDMKNSKYVKSNELHTHSEDKKVYFFRS